MSKFTLNIKINHFAETIKKMLYSYCQIAGLCCMWVSGFLCGSGCIFCMVIEEALSSVTSVGTPIFMVSLFYGLAYSYI